MRFDNSGNTPAEGFDFDFDLTTDPDNPSVDLTEGDIAGTTIEWRIWCEDSAGVEANIGAITGLLAEDYDVTILDDQTPVAGPGAASVGEIDLNPSADANYSSITDGRITGSLGSGGLFVEEASGGNGGLLNFTVDGNVGGTVTADNVALLHIGGNYTGLGMDFTQILAFGLLEVEGDLNGDVDLGTLKFGGTTKIWGAVAQATTIDIKTMEQATFVHLNFDGTSQTAGNLILGSGVPPGSAVTVHDLTGTGSVNFAKNDLVGQMVVFGDLAGDIVKVNDITSGWLDVHGTLKGTGRILVDGICTGEHLGSDITIFEATESLSLIRITEGIEGSCAIVINDDEGDFDASGDIVIGVGGIPLPAVTFDGSILVMDNGTGGNGDLFGDIDVIGCHPENHGFLDICIEGDVLQLGAISIVQGSCSYPVCGYQGCDVACP